jgi:hypothetical protein
MRGPVTDSICLVSVCANEPLPKGFALPRLTGAKATINTDFEIALSGTVRVEQFSLSQRQQVVIAQAGAPETRICEARTVCDTAVP